MWAFSSQQWHIDSCLPESPPPPYSRLSPRDEYKPLGKCVFLPTLGEVCPSQAPLPQCKGRKGSPAWLPLKWGGWSFTNTPSWARADPASAAGYLHLEIPRSSLTSLWPLNMSLWEMNGFWLQHLIGGGLGFLSLFLSFSPSLRWFSFDVY